MKLLMGNKALLTRLGRSYNVFVWDSNNEAQEFVSYLCLRRDVFKSAISESRNWTMVVFDDDDSLMEKPRVFKGEQLVAGFEVTVLFVHSPGLSEYSVTWNDSKELAIESIKEFLRQSVFLNHILVLSSFPYEREDLIDKFIPKLRFFPQSLSIGVLKGIGHYGATDLESPHAEVDKTVDKYKQWYGKDAFVSKIEVCSGNENSVIMCFRNILHPSVKYRSFIGESSIDDLKEARRSLDIWDKMLPLLFRLDDLSHSRWDEIRKTVSQCIVPFDKYHLSEICPDWEDVVKKCVEENRIDQMESDLKLYFQDTITNLIRQCEEFLSPS